LSKISSEHYFQNNGFPIILFLCPERSFSLTATSEPPYWYKWNAFFPRVFPITVLKETAEEFNEKIRVFYNSGNGTEMRRYFAAFTQQFCIWLELFPPKKIVVALGFALLFPLLIRARAILWIGARASGKKLPLWH